ncbi:MAG: universal stress protein [Acidobacteria bacterium]|nr:universal stress protein [Acidobacteriota bacterium]
MDRFQRVLLYVDPSRRPDAAFDRAVRLCQESGSKLRLLAVTPELSVYLRYPPFSYPSLEETLRKSAEESLLSLAARAREAGLDVTTDVRHGKPFLEIAREAAGFGADLVMLDAPTSDRDAKTTAMGLFRLCPGAVWAVRPPAHTYTRILAPVDPTAYEPREPGLNREILDTAASLADLDGGRMDVLHAWSAGPGAEAFREEIAKAAGEAFEKLVAAYGLPPEQVHLVEDDPADAIRAFVERNGVDLVVMGTLVRTGIAGVLIGNTAERALSALDCSVLALKPAGFVSPVEDS